MTGLYHTKTTITIDVKINENDDYYYLFINDIFIKKYKSKNKIYNYLRCNYGITIMI